jgi:hypothetical protein
MPAHPGPFRLAIVLLVTAVMAACGSSESKWPDVLTLESDKPYARIVSNELAVDEDRFVFGLFEPTDEPIAGAEVAVKFYNLGRSRDEPVGEVPASQINTRGAVPEYEILYVTRFNFSEPGEWGAEFDVRRPSGEEFTVRYRFPVREKSEVLNVGDPVPATDNLTLADVARDITDRDLTTDPEPDPALYQVTVAEATAARKPFVVVLATPGFCVTRTCGPMVDVVKSVRPEFAGRVNFIHIEITDLDATTSQGEVVYNSFYREWNLETEPWAFVVDPTGRVAARFEGVLLPDELREALTSALETGTS